MAPTSIQLALARGHRWLAMLESGETKSLKEIATREGIDNSYPMLHGLEKKGYLTSRHERTGRRGRRVYEITEQGRVALTDAKAKVKELFGELIESH